MVADPREAEERLLVFQMPSYDIHLIAFLSGSVGLEGFDRFIMRSHLSYELFHLLGLKRLYDQIGIESTKCFGQTQALHPEIIALLLIHRLDSRDIRCDIADDLIS